jgi:hypothetical protein
LSGERKCTLRRPAPATSPAAGVAERARLSGRKAWILMALLLAAACSDSVTAPVAVVPPADPALVTAAALRGAHLWVFHISGGRYAEHIQLVMMGDGTSRQTRRLFRPIASRAWDGTTTNDFARLRARPDDPTGLRWTLRDASGHTLRLAYTLRGDTATGALTLRDATRYPLVGVRFSAAVVTLIAPALAQTSHDSQPAVLIRLDDVPGTDRDFLGRLQARGLTAEIAVPTRFAGQPNRLTWDELRSWRAAGMGVVLHSRYHLSTGADAQHFISETVGGFAEMAAHGFATHVFVQPGTWRDSIYFDSPTKLHTWRGALLRTFTTVAECYARRYSLPRADSLALGLPHVTISDGISDSVTRRIWEVALRPNHVTVFLVHTARLTTPNQLDWFLDDVATARARGAVRVVANSEDLFWSVRTGSGGDPLPGEPELSGRF